MEKLEVPEKKELPPKEDWFSSFVPYEPVLDQYQPENGDIRCQGELFKGAYPKGTGTDKLMTEYVYHASHCGKCDKNEWLN